MFIFLFSWNLIWEIVLWNRNTCETSVCHGTAIKIGICCDVTTCVSVDTNFSKRFLPVLQRTLTGLHYSDLKFRFILRTFPSPHVSRSNHASPVPCIKSRKAIICKHTNTLKWMSNECVCVRACVWNFLKMGEVSVASRGQEIVSVASQSVCFMRICCVSSRQLRAYELHRKIWVYKMSRNLKVLTQFYCTLLCTQLYAQIQTCWMISTMHSCHIMLLSNA
jgi:hypothetical protein